MLNLLFRISWLGASLTNFLTFGRFISEHHMIFSETRKRRSAQTRCKAAHSSLSSLNTRLSGVERECHHFTCQCYKAVDYITWSNMNVLLSAICLWIPYVLNSEIPMKWVRLMPDLGPRFENGKSLVNSSPRNSLRCFEHAAEADSKSHSVLVKIW